jgi:integrase
MTGEKPIIKTDLNSESDEKIIFPSQQSEMRPAAIAGFSFIQHYGDKMGTRKFIHYKPAKIYSKKDKWFVWYSYFNPPENRYVRFRVYEDVNRIKDLKEKKEYAELLRDAVNYGLRHGYNPFEKEDNRKSWSLIQGLNYFKQHLYDRGLRKRSIQSYESVIRAMYKGFKPYLLNDIDEITQHHVRSFLSGNDWSNTTFNNNLTLVRTIFNYLIEAEVMEKNPASKVKGLPENIKKHRYFEDYVWKKIKEKAAPELLRFILFLYHTGTRPNEARQLKYEHILRDRKLLFVPASISKNKKDDYVPLSEFVLNEFNGEGFIFGTSINFFSQKFIELKKQLKLHKDVTLYSVKHTRAVHLALDGASPYAISALFRHSSLEITMKYLRDLGINVNREAADKVRII